MSNVKKFRIIKFKSKPVLSAKSISKSFDGRIILRKIDMTLNQGEMLGLLGSNGAGKSTFIENFGTELTNLGKKVAVLTIDPSSSISKGSILGDKTRMEKLSQNKNVFIRPTAASNFQGGVAKNTRESIFLCESSGYDVIIVETVGVGQNEISVSEMVDFFLLLKIAVSSAISPLEVFIIILFSKLFNKLVLIIFLVGNFETTVSGIWKDISLHFFT